MFEGFKFEYHLIYVMRIAITAVTIQILKNTNY